MSNLLQILFIIFNITFMLYVFLNYKEAKKNKELLLELKKLISEDSKKVLNEVHKSLEETMCHVNREAYEVIKVLKENHIENREILERIDRDNSFIKVINRQISDKLNKQIPRIINKKIRYIKNIVQKEHNINLHKFNHKKSSTNKISFKK